MAADYYKELGVSRSATDDEIKKAYRKLAAQLHPDKNPGDKKTEARFKNVNRAYQALSDKEKRGLYDEFGEEGLREGFNSQAARAYRGGPGSSPGGYRRRTGSGGVNIEDLFTSSESEPQGAGGIGDLFGDLFSRAGRRGGGVGPSSKGSDIASEVSVDFISALRGAELKLRLQDGGDEITVRVPPGAGDGDKVRIAGHGAPGSYGGPPGDLILNIRVTKHPYFERSGLDLYLDLPITVGEAYRGDRYAHRGEAGAARRIHRVRACRGEWLVGAGERQPVDDHQLARIAGHVHALPEREHAHQTGGGFGPEPADQQRERLLALQQHGQVGLGA